MFIFHQLKQQESVGQSDYTNADKEIKLQYVVQPGRIYFVYIWDLLR